MDMDDGTLSQAAFSGLYKNISGHFSHILYFKKMFTYSFSPLLMRISPTLTATEQNS
jgi:hypothetical protein